MSRKSFKVLLICFLVGFFISCTAYDLHSSADKEECLICKHNGDLACLYVEPKDSTPHVKMDGKIYYFCSEDCKQAFLKQYTKNFM